MLKTILRKILNKICQFNIRGRYRLADKVGLWIAPNNIDFFFINGIPLEIDHSMSSNRYVYYGVYEVNLISFLHKHIRSNDICLDPGTNIGYIAAIESGIVGRNGMVYCFEPSKTCYDKLIRYMPKNTNNNIVIYNAAISNKNGEAVFVDSPRVISHGWAALKEAYEDIEGDSYLIKTYTVDSFCMQNDIKSVRFLKLDVEEAEWMAIEGSVEMLKKHQIDYLLVESAFVAENEWKNKLIEKTLKQFNYKPYKLRNDGTLTLININDLLGERLDLIWTYL